MDAAEFDRSDFIYSFGQVWKKVMTDPQGFFLAMPLRGGLGNPLAFAALSLAIAGVGFLLTGRGVKLSLILLVWGIVRLFIGAAILSLVARKLFDGKGDFETTFRVCAYAAAPVTLLWVPVIGYLAVLYVGYLVIVGLQRAHEFDSVRAVLTVVLTVVVGIVLSLPFGGPARLWRTMRFASVG
jgi:hypothetical protein